MRNILLTASLVCNMFMSVAVYAFVTGHMQFQSADYATQLAEYTPAQPVRLNKR